ALLQGRPVAGQRAAEGRHDHLPREHRGSPRTRPSFPQLLLGFEKLHHRIRKRRPPLYHRSHLSRWKQRQISDTTCSPYLLWDRGIRRVEELSTDRLTGEHDPATRRKLSS